MSQKSGPAVSAEMLLRDIRYARRKYRSVEDKMLDITMLKDLNSKKW